MNWMILGIHGEKVLSVAENVARVRMFVGDRIIDEDFTLPVLHKGVPAIEEVYESYLRETIDKRFAELQGGADVNPVGSLVVHVKDLPKTLEERIAALEALA